jgi:D-glycero-alpha-D-manno-heptose-7-phosphate kinase
VKLWQHFASISPLTMGAGLVPLGTPGWSVTTIVRPKEWTAFEPCEGDDWKAILGLWRFVWENFVKRVRVLVANRPRLMRELVMATIADQPDIELVGEVIDEAELAEVVEQVQPDVLILAINKYFYTILGKRTDGRVQIISSDLRIFETWSNVAAMDVRGSGLEIPVAVLKDLDCDFSVDLFLASEIPPGTGLGSSASVCVNLLKTLSTYRHQPLSKHDLAEHSFRIAREVLGRHVGRQDEFAAAFGGLNFISFHPDGRTEVVPVELDAVVLQELQSSLMLFFTGSAHHSWTILKEQEHSTRGRTGPATEALHEVRALADQMLQTLKAGDLDSFGSLLDQGWQAKKRVSGKISNPVIDHLYELARRHGALGGKITGAGGGGFLLLYCPPLQQEAVRLALAAEGVRDMAFAFDNTGTQVVVNDPFIDGDTRAGLRWIFQPVSAEDRSCAGGFARRLAAAEHPGINP